MKIKETNQDISKYEMNPSKYIIINEDIDHKLIKGNNNKSVNQTYYPYVKTDERTRQFEEHARNAIKGLRDNTKVYNLDPYPYYGKELPKIHSPNLPRDTYRVGIDLHDLTYSFPSTKNLRKLKAELNRLTGNQDINGFKPLNKQNNAYYDPTEQMRQEKILLLKQKIKQMDFDLSHDYKPKVVYEKDTAELKIQNHQNFDKETSNKFVVDSYFYPVDKKKVANGTIDETRSSYGYMVRSKYVDNDKKIYGEAESIGAILGNKYVKDEIKVNATVNATKSVYEKSVKGPITNPKNNTRFKKPNNITLGPKTKNYLPSKQININATKSVNGTIANAKNNTHLKKPKTVTPGKSPINELPSNKISVNETLNSTKSTYQKTVEGSIAKSRKENIYYYNNGQIVFPNGLQTIKLNNTNSSKTEDSEKYKYIDVKQILTKALGAKSTNGLPLVTRMEDIPTEANNQLGKDSTDSQVIDAASYKTEIEKTSSNNIQITQDATDAKDSQKIIE